MSDPDTPGTDRSNAEDTPSDDPESHDGDGPVPSGDPEVDAHEPSGAGPPANGDASGAGETYGPTDGPSGREVVVPARLYKTVTVMSTLVAMVSVVGGFVALDAATNRASAAAGEIDTPVALLGLGLIVGGAAAYAFATRFRAADPDGDDESGDADGEESHDMARTGD